MQRRYIPEVGSLVRFRTLSDYQSRYINGWAWMRVVAFNGDTVTARHAPNPSNPAWDEDPIQFPLSIVEPPLGWNPHYAIYCDPAKAQTVIDDWFQRGIRVSVSHDMSCPRGDIFQPLISKDGENTPDRPHWAYYGADAVPAEQCPEVFTVFAQVEQEFHMPKSTLEKNYVKRAHVRRGWRVWHENHGVYSRWMRAKEVALNDTDRPGWRHVLQPGEFDPPETALDILWRLQSGMDRKDDSERAARGEPCPQWILCRAFLHLKGDLDSAGNSTWMFDPEAQGDPVRRG